MSDLWREVTTWLAEATRSAIKETEELARRGRFKVEMLGINTALQDRFAALGGTVYEILKRGGRASIKTNPKVKKLVEEIEALEARLHEAKGGETPVKKKPAAKKAKGGKPSTSKQPVKKRTPTKRPGGKSAASGSVGRKRPRT